MLVINTGEKNVKRKNNKCFVSPNAPAPMSVVP